MLFKQIPYSILFILITLFSHCRNDEFTLVSSTQLPQITSQNSENEELRNTIVAINKRLELLESQNTVQKQIESAPQENNCREDVPRNCQEVLEGGNETSGIYKIKPNFDDKEISVLCDMRKRGGGWTYILNRFDGSQDFYLNWTSYREGFGKLHGEFWLGLENIHLLTGYELNKLLLELVDWEDKTVYALYDLFTIGSEKEGYSLKYLQGYKGDAGDDLSHQLGMKFTTKDRDQDVWYPSNCATFSNGGWWYRDCKHGHPTGVYLGQHFYSGDNLKGIFWDSFHGSSYSLKEVRMMVRPQRPVKVNPAL